MGLGEVRVGVMVRDRVASCDLSEVGATCPADHPAVEEEGDVRLPGVGLDGERLALGAWPRPRDLVRARVRARARARAGARAKVGAGTRAKVRTRVGLWPGLGLGLGLGLAAPTRPPRWASPSSIRARWHLVRVTVRVRP